MFSCEFCEICKNTYFYRTPPVAASKLTLTLLLNWFLFRRWNITTPLMYLLLSKYEMSFYQISDSCKTQTSWKATKKHYFLDPGPIYYFTAPITFTHLWLFYQRCNHFITTLFNLYRPSSKTTFSQPPIFKYLLSEAAIYCSSSMMHRHYKLKYIAG